MIGNRSPVATSLNVRLVNARAACQSGVGLLVSTTEAKFPLPQRYLRKFMARVTVEDCLEVEDNRFALVVLAAQRARQLIKGADPLVNASNRQAVLSLREIAAGKVHFDRPTDDVIMEWLEELGHSTLR